MKTVILITECENWLIQRAKMTHGLLPGVAQLSSYTPSVSDMNALLVGFTADHETSGIKYELFEIRGTRDIEVLIGRISREVVFYFLCDGYLPYLGTPLSETFKSLGASVFGSSVSACNLAQDKYVQFLMLKELGIKTPHTWLSSRFNDDSTRSSSYFVKPRNLGNSIGIFDDAYSCTPDECLKISNRIEDLYGLPAIIQEFIPGTYARASFIGSQDRTPSANLVGTYVMETDPTPNHVFIDFEKYHSNYVTSSSTYNSRVKCTELSEYSFQGAIDVKAILAELDISLQTIFDNIGLQDFFTIDLIINQTGVYILEMNTSPFPRNKSLEPYCCEKFAVGKNKALGNALARAFC